MLPAPVVSRTSDAFSAASTLHEEVRLPEVSETSKLQLTGLPFNTALDTATETVPVDPSQTLTVADVNDASGVGFTVST